MCKQNPGSSSIFREIVLTMNREGGRKNETRNQEIEKVKKTESYETLVSEIKPCL